jgi:hypothetical protein
MVERVKGIELLSQAWEDSLPRRDKLESAHWLPGGSPGQQLVDVAKHDGELCGITLPRGLLKNRVEVSAPLQHIHLDFDRICLNANDG